MRTTTTGQVMATLARLSKPPVMGIGMGTATGTAMTTAITGTSTQVG